MKRNGLFGIIALWAACVMAADSNPRDEVLAAAKKLSGESNYAWKSSTSWGGFDGSAEGKVEKGGAMFLTSTFGDSATEVAFRDKKIAIKPPDGEWQTVDELEAGDEWLGRFLGRWVRNFKAPAAEIEDLVSKAKELKKEADVCSAELTSEGAAELLAGGRGPDVPPVKNAKGSVRFWLKDRAVQKYELRLQGTMNWGGEERDTDRTTTTEVKDVGTTKVTLPEAAQKKLS